MSSRGIGAAKQRYTVFGLFEVACASGTGVQRRRWNHSPPQASFIRVEQLVLTVPFVSDYFLQLLTKWADCGRVRRQNFTTKLCVSNSMAIVEALQPARARLETLRISVWIELLEKRQHLFLHQRARNRSTFRSLLAEPLPTSVIHQIIFSITNNTTLF